MYCFNLTRKVTSSMLNCKISWHNWRTKKEIISKFFKSYWYVANALGCMLSFWLASDVAFHLNSMYINLTLAQFVSVDISHVFDCNAPSCTFFNNHIPLHLHLLNFTSIIMKLFMDMPEWSVFSTSLIYLFRIINIFVSHGYFWEAKKRCK